MKFTGITSLPIPSAGINPILSDLLAAVAIERIGALNAIFLCFSVEYRGDLLMAATSTITIDQLHGSRDLLAFCFHLFSTRRL